MPLLGAVQTPTSLSTGERVELLAGENLANNGVTMAVSLTPQPTPVVLAIWNNSGESVSLVASPDLTSADFLPVYNEAGNEVTVGSGEVGTALVAPGLYYAVKAGGAITAGTIWLAR
jgi:hypothetical protein